MLQARAAAALDREQIKPSIPTAPDDFDAFWSDQRAKLAAVPLNIRTTPVKQKDPAVEVFDVQADVGDGAVMSGYFARPVNAMPKSLPAIVFGHGAGVASSRMGIVTEFAKKGMLALDFNAHGIANHDWFVTWGGDGFHTRIDPTDPSIVYATLQHGVLARHDRRSGESVLIQPQEAPGDAPLRWNWDSPLVLSPHKATRLYFAAQRVFRSDDRGDSWTPVSGDLTRHLDRNELEVMGRVWGPDAVGKSQSTSFYGNIVSLEESPLAEGLRLLANPTTCLS
jgi:hypothetical protein